MAYTVPGGVLPQGNVPLLVPLTLDDMDSLVDTPAVTSSPASLVTLVMRMLGPRSHEAPCFKGKKLKKFLHKFELLAKGARITDEQKCEYVVMYCKEKEAKFIQTLPGFKEGEWETLRSEMLGFYPAKQEDHVYRIKDLQCFIQQECKIRCLVDLDKYHRKFRVMSTLLESKSCLHEIEQDDFSSKASGPRLSVSTSNMT